MDCCEIMDKDWCNLQKNRIAVRLLLEADLSQTAALNKDFRAVNDWL